MQETQTPSLGREVPPGKEMASHSSTLARRIPWTEGPGGLQPMGSHTVRRDRSDLTHTHIHTYVSMGLYVHAGSQLALWHSLSRAGAPGDMGSISGSGRSPEEGNGNPLPYSCCKNLMDRRAWRATVHGVARVGHNLVTKPPPPSHTLCCWVQHSGDPRQI